MKRGFLALLCLALAGCGGQPGPSRPGQYGKAQTFKAVDRFEITEFPPLTKGMRAWFELPLENEPAQQISDLRIESPLPYSIREDGAAGNRFLYVEVPPGTALPVVVTVSFTTARKEILGSNGEPLSLPWMEATWSPTCRGERPDHKMAAKAVAEDHLNEDQALYEVVMVIVLGER